EFSQAAPIDILEVLPYADYQSVIGIIILLFAIVLAPDLLCPDRRDGTLALYFATAVGRTEYLAGRFLGAALPLLMVTLVPMLLLFAGVAFFDESPLGYLREEWAQLPRMLVAGLLLAVYYAAVALAVASLTERRAYAIGGYVLLLISSTAIAVLIQEARRDATYAEVGELSALPIGLARTLWPDSDLGTPTWAWAVGYLIVVGASAAVLLRRYRPERL
ncbi:MAG: ABC transporter permease subunit, partial [Miltoncostaeaceae bacterium]